MAEAEAPKSLTDADDPSAILKGDGPPPGGDPPPSSPPAENKESPTDSPSKKAAPKKPMGKMGAVGAPSKKPAAPGGMSAAKSKFETGGGTTGGAKPSWKKGAPGAAVSGAAAIKEAMLSWCQSKTRGYEHADVTNFSSSWANGMAFCAIVHGYAPDKIDYNSLNPKARRKNFDIAFRVADEVLGAHPLLDVEDMIAMGNKPDWKCVFTYVQSLCRHGQDFDKRKEKSGESKPEGAPPAAATPAAATPAAATPAAATPAAATPAAAPSEAQEAAPITTSEVPAEESKETKTTDPETKEE